MLEITDLNIEGYDRVIEARNKEAGLHCIIAIHNCVLGPSTGGTRIYPYGSREEALKDALKLAKAMTYKTAAIPIGFGGSKGVIIADPIKDKTPELLLAYADVVNLFEGNFITGEDIGMNIEDVQIMHSRSPYFAAYDIRKSSGDPSRFAARGVFRGIQAVAKTLWGSTSLKKKKILIQGIGNVGSKLADFLFWEGAELLFTEVNSKKVQALAHLYGAKIVPTDQFYLEPCDIFAPCAMGTVIHEKNIHHLHFKAIAGSANNQLEHEGLSDILKQKNILYAPDFIISAGGVINMSLEFEPGGYQPHLANQKMDEIYDRLIKIFEIAKQENKTTTLVAKEIAEYNLLHQIGKRQIPLIFNF